MFQFSSSQPPHIRLVQKGSVSLPKRMTTRRVIFSSMQAIFSLNNVDTQALFFGKHKNVALRTE